MEIIEGIVDDIKFQNEDNGYTIAKIKNDSESIVIVGIMPLLKINQNISLKGSYMIHKQFGKQFKVEECKELLPKTSFQIEKYLSSGIIKGIGPVTAKRIVDKFKETTLDILENNIEKLRSVEGIGKKKFDIIYESYNENKDLKDVIIFFQNYGISLNQTLKIYKKYGVECREKITENPYLLSDEIKGIGFLTADKIAISIGIKTDSNFRIRSGIKHTLSEFSTSGNTYMPKDLLINSSKKLLQLDEKLIEENIYNEHISNFIKVDKINEEEVVYLTSYYYCELGVTNNIIKLSVANFKSVNTDILFEIKNFEKKNNVKFANSQKDAILGAFENGIEIITGGPGTGKTTIIKCIIEIYENCNMKVLLCAPTGRASKRMTESTGREAKTIHRLLEIGLGDDDKTFFAKGEEDQLEANVIIIDEASMVDIMLMQSLLKSIRVGTRVIIVGDIDQLPSVGAGNVLGDLINSNYLKVIRLNEIFRQGKESLIITNAHKINNCEMPCSNKKDGDFFFDQKDYGEQIVQTILELVNRRVLNFDKSFDKIKDIQVLSPTRKGELGIENLNNELQNILNPAHESKKEKSIRDIVFREEDKVIQIKNNYSIEWTRISGKGDNQGKGVFNGDMGIIKHIDIKNKKVVVIFDEERKVIYDFPMLDELELAYAITIHKSQGSEFKAVIMPVFMGPPMLMNKNLLYTGITRAKKLVVIVGNKKSLSYMISNKNSSKRYSGLRYRIESIVSNNIFEK